MYPSGKILNMEGNQQQGGNGGGSNAVLAVVVLAVIALAAFFAYKQGYLSGKEQEPSETTIEINLPTGSPTASPAY
jgi:hypothetical protein